MKVKALGISANLENEDVKRGMENSVSACVRNASIENVNAESS